MALFRSNCSIWPYRHSSPGRHQVVDVALLVPLQATLQRCLILAGDPHGSARPALAETGASERLPITGAARCRARPTTLVHEMAASVTSGRHGAGSAVRDDGICRRGSAASRGDVAGTDDVAVPEVATGPTREAPAPGLGRPRLALRTGRRGAPLVDAHDVDAREVSLVREGAEQTGAPPGVRHAAVLATPGVEAS